MSTALEIVVRLGEKESVTVIKKNLCRVLQNQIYRLLNYTFNSHTLQTQENNDNDFPLIV